MLRCLLSPGTWPSGDGGDRRMPLSGFRQGSCPAGGAVLFRSPLCVGTVQDSTCQRRFGQVGEAALDFGALIGHGPLKCYVMGERCYNHDEELAEDDLDLMKQVVAQAVAAGAMGFSTSRILGHRGADGNPLPGTFALERELRGICEAVAAGG